MAVCPVVDRVVAICKSLRHAHRHRCVFQQQQPVSRTGAVKDHMQMLFSRHLCCECTGSKATAQVRLAHLRAAAWPGWAAPRCPAAGGRAWRCRPGRPGGGLAWTAPSPVPPAPCQGRACRSPGYPACAATRHPGHHSCLCSMTSPRTLWKLWRLIVKRICRAAGQRWVMLPLGVLQASSGTCALTPRGLQHKPGRSPAETQAGQQTKAVRSTPVVAVRDARDARVAVLCRHVGLQPGRQLRHLWQRLPRHLRLVLLRPAPDLRTHSGIRTRSTVHTTARIEECSAACTSSACM